MDTPLAPSGEWADVTRDESSLKRFLHGLPGVDQVGAEQRCAALATRSIKTTAKAWAIDTAISMVDLTTLEGNDTHGKVASLCARAANPDPTGPWPGDVPPPRVAAVCVYPDLVETAVQRLQGTGVKVAAVATAFPSGRASLDVKISDTQDAVEAGADEIDMVIDRGAFLSGRYGQVFDEIVAIREACGAAHLKVILETGELVTLDNVRRASWLALLAGGHVIKTSTGKVNPAATPPVALTMLQAVRDFAGGGRGHGAAAAGGTDIRGVKLAGGIRTTKDAVRYLVIVNEVAGPEWLHPDQFRFGASSLLDDLVLQRHKLATGAYDSVRYVSHD
ncbi:deoxyribose-phosphate aldolase [Jatrophihabitans sp. YIM 134969]